MDIGHYLDALVSRWWLPLAGLVVGVALGYLLALGGNQVYNSEATVYVGTPFSPGGGAPLQGLATNPNTVARIARGQETLQTVSSESGMSVRELRAGVSTRAIKSGLAKTAPNQLYVVSVQGSHRDEVNKATAAIAERVVERSRRLREAEEEDISGGARLRQSPARGDRPADGGGAGGDGPRLRARERLTLATLLLTAEQRRGRSSRTVSRPGSCSPSPSRSSCPASSTAASATKTTARSARNSTAVAGLIGLILGILAALFWEPIVARTGRR